MHTKILYNIFLLFIVSAVTAQTDQQIQSNKDALRIAKLSVAAMGGLNYYNATNYIGWNFFGNRQLIWDKKNKRVRIDFLKTDITIITDLETTHGKLFMYGKAIIQTDSLKKYLEKGKSIWRNDSYWLVMPFKLFDPGVYLNYEGVKKTTDSIDAHVIKVTFNKDVGETPQNKYYIYFDMKTHFVIQWDFYAVNGHLQPELTNTWGSYKKYGNIYLSSDRGDRGKLTDIHVWRYLPESIFIDLEILPFNKL